MAVDVVDRFWVTCLKPYFCRMESMIWGKAATRSWAVVDRRAMGMCMGSAYVAGEGAARATDKRASATKKREKESMRDGGQGPCVYKPARQDNARLRTVSGNVPF